MIECNVKNLRFVDADGHARNEGDIQVSPGGPYAISYRALRPKREECTNLLVPVCLSSTHIAYGSIRMEPVFMILGHSAGAAAVFAIEDGVEVQRVPYAKLRARLLADGQVLEFAVPPKPAGGASSFDPLRPGGTVVDDAAAVVTGEWAVSSATGPYVGTGYRHDGAAGKGAKSVRFEGRLPADGRYEVRFAYTPHANRCRAVPVTVRHAGGEAKLAVDETKAPTHDGAFVVLGTWDFKGGGTVEVATTGTSGYVVVDAVLFLPVKE